MQVYGVSFGTSARGGERPGGRASRRVPAAILWATDGVALDEEGARGRSRRRCPGRCRAGSVEHRQRHDQDGAEQRDSRQERPEGEPSEGAGRTFLAHDRTALRSGKRHKAREPANDHALFALVSLCLRQCGPPWGRIFVEPRRHTDARGPCRSGLRAAAAQGGVARAHRRDARAGAGVRAGGAQRGPPAVRRRGRARAAPTASRTCSRSSTSTTPTAPCSSPSRTSTTSRRPTCHRRPVKACATPRSSSTRRRTPSAGWRSRPAAWASVAPCPMARRSWGSRRA